MQRRLLGILGFLVAMFVAYVGLALFAPNPLDGVAVPAWEEHGPPTLEVLLTGAGAQPLRWAPTDERTARFALHTNERSRIEIGPELLLATDAEVRLTVEGTASPLQGGRALWRWRVRRVELLSATASGAVAVGDPRAGFAELTGRRGRTEFDDRGFVVERSAEGGRLKTPAGLAAAAALDAMLGDAVVHVPEAPVGAGGSWAVRRDRSQAGLRFRTRDRWDVRSVGDEVELTGLRTGEAVPGPLELGFGDGTIESGSVEGRASLLLRLGEDFVAEGQGSTAFRVQAELSVMGLPAAASVVGEQSVSIERLP